MGFQVDIGPVLYPDFRSMPEGLISGLELAYIMYNELDTVEFAVRVPTPVAEGQNLETLHYSRVVQMPASNQLFTLAP